MDKLTIAINALVEIYMKQGLVCDELALCDHKACASSYASWAIADKALTELKAKGVPK